MPKTVTAFRCAYCADIIVFPSRAECLKHEAFCPQAPGSRSCHSCAHLVVTDIQSGAPQYSDLVFTEYRCGVCVPQGKPIIFGCRGWAQKSVS